MVESYILQNVLCICHGILYSLKKDGDSDTCYSLDGLNDLMLGEMSVTIGQILYDSTYMKFLEQSNAETK